MGGTDGATGASAGGVVGFGFWVELFWSGIFNLQTLSKHKNQTPVQLFP